MIRTASVRLFIFSALLADLGGMTEERMKKAGPDGASIDFDTCQEGGFSKNNSWNYLGVS